MHSGHLSIPSRQLPRVHALSPSLVCPARMVQQPPSHQHASVTHHQPLQNAPRQRTGHHIPSSTHAKDHHRKTITSRREHPTATRHTLPWGRRPPISTNASNRLQAKIPPSSLRRSSRRTYTPHARGAPACRRCLELWWTSSTPQRPRDESCRPRAMGVNDPRLGDARPPPTPIERRRP